MAFLSHRRKAWRIVSGGGGGGPAVAFDSAFEKGSLSATSPFAFTSNAGDVTGTVNSNSNRVLIAYAVFRAAVESAVAMTWNGVSMTQIGTMQTYGGGLFNLYLFGLINPNTGNQSISTSWTGGASVLAVGAVSLYNVNQSTAWQNFGFDTSTGTSASSTVTSANGNMVVVGHSNNDASSTTINVGTSAWLEQDLSGNSAMGYNASTSTSTIITWTLGTSVEWGNIKVDVIKA